MIERITRCTRRVPIRVFSGLVMFRLADLKVSVHEGSSS